MQDIVREPQFVTRDMMHEAPVLSSLHSTDHSSAVSESDEGSTMPSSGKSFTVPAMLPVLSRSTVKKKDDIILC
jgi:hypothetical protein